MPIAQWPASLPGPTRDNFSQGRQDGRQERTGETGPPRFKRRFSSVAKGVSMTVFCDVSQTWQLDAFYERDLKEGALPFYMPDALLNGKPLATEGGLILTDGAGAPLLMSKVQLCQFGGPPQIVPASHQHNRVSFTVWYLPQ